MDSRQGNLQEHAVNQVDSDRPDAPSLRMSGVVRTAVTTDRETRVAFGRGAGLHADVADSLRRVKPRRLI